MLQHPAKHGVDGEFSENHCMCNYVIVFDDFFVCVCSHACKKIKHTGTSFLSLLLRLQHAKFRDKESKYFLVHDMLCALYCASFTTGSTLLSVLKSGRHLVLQ